MTPGTESFDDLPSHTPKTKCPKRLGGGFCTFYFDIKIRQKKQE
jgi:hypothetical protein